MIKNKKTALNARILRLVGGDKHAAYLWWNSVNKTLGTTPTAMWKGTRDKPSNGLTLIMYVLSISDVCRS